MPIYVKIDGLAGFGDVQADGYADGNWFEAEDFGFGIDRELKESGRKGGTEDINIGIGELQECTISRSMSIASPLLSQFAINGNSCGTAQFDFVRFHGEGEHVYLRYKLDRCFVKSWSTIVDSEDLATSSLSFYFNKIAYTFAGSPHVLSWDRVKGIPWSGHGLSALPAPGER